MPITIKCPDCGYAAQSEDGEPEECPKCDGTMTPVKKKPPLAKAAPPADEPRAKARPKPREEDDDRPKKPKRRGDDDDGDDEPPAKPKAAARPRDDDEDDRPAKRKKSSNPRDGAAAERADLPSGFEDDELVAQVEEELQPGEVLHFACRQARKLAQLQAALYALVASAFVFIPGLMGLSFLVSAKDAKDYLFALVPLAVAAGAAVVAVLSARGRLRQAARGWYAVTDRRAIVFEVSLFRGTGEATTYTPQQVRKMWVRKSSWLKGGGDVVFKTVVTITTEVSRSSEKTSKSTTHFGFIGVEDVESVRDVIEWVLLSERDDDDDEDEE